MYSGYNPTISATILITNDTRQRVHVVWVAVDAKTDQVIDQAYHILLPGKTNRFFIPNASVNGAGFIKILHPILPHHICVLQEQPGVYYYNVSTILAQCPSPPTTPMTPDQPGRRSLKYMGLPFHYGSF